MSRLSQLNRNEKPSWAVAVHRADVPGETEMAEAICRSLRELGYLARVVLDGDPAGLQADILLLHPNASNFAAYAHQLRCAGPKRPFVLVWQMDPLPPTELTAEAERDGLQAAVWRRRLGLIYAGHMPRWRKLATAVRLRGRIYRLLSGIGYRKCCRSVSEQLGDEVQLDWKLVRGVMETWESLRLGLAERWIDRVAVSTVQRQQFLLGRSIEAPFVPVGSCPEWGENLQQDRDTDVLFLGRVKHSSRGAQLDYLDSELRESGITIHRITRDCFGRNRTEWLNRAKLMLNLNQYPWSPAWIRFTLASLCGTAVVSEPMSDQEPFTTGIHYASAPVRDLPQTILNLLKDSAHRERLAGAAAALCQGSLTMHNSVEALANLTEF